MLRHTSTGTFATIGPYTVTLKVTNLPTSGSYDIAVFGIETVFIPKGAYTLGTLGDGMTGGTRQPMPFEQNGNNGDPHVPYNITSENTISLKWGRL
jgi:hypothetical protein